MKIIEYLRNPPPPPLRLVVSLRRACRNTSAVPDFDINQKLPFFPCLVKQGGGRR